MACMSSEEGCSLCASRSLVSLSRRHAGTWSLLTDYMIRLCAAGLVRALSRNACVGAFFHPIHCGFCHRIVSSTNYSSIYFKTLISPHWTLSPLWKHLYDDRPTYGKVAARNFGWSRFVVSLELIFFNNVGKPLPIEVTADNVFSAVIPLSSMDWEELAFFEASVCICEEGIEPFPESVETAEEISLYFWMEEQSPS